MKLLPDEVPSILTLCVQILQSFPEQLQVACRDAGISDFVLQQNSLKAQQVLFLKLKSCLFDSWKLKSM